MEDRRRKSLINWPYQPKHSPYIIRAHSVCGSNVIEAPRVNLHGNWHSVQMCGLTMSQRSVLALHAGHYRSPQARINNWLLNIFNQVSVCQGRGNDFSTGWSRPTFSSWGSGGAIRPQRGPGCEKNFPEEFRPSHYLVW